MHCILLLNLHYISYKDIKIFVKEGLSTVCLFLISVLGSNKYKLVSFTSLHIFLSFFFLSFLQLINVYHLYRLNSESASHEQTSYKKIRTPIPFILKRQYKIQTFLYMSNNNSSANIINSNTS